MTLIVMWVFLSHPILVPLHRKLIGEKPTGYLVIRQLVSINQMSHYKLTIRMNMRYKVIQLLILVAFLAQAQQSPYINWTLLPPSIMNEIIGETSGEATLRYVQDMGSYERNRSLSEYTEIAHEVDYFRQKMEEFGLNGSIEQVATRKTWNGISGSLWEIKPERAKLADYFDLTAHLAEGSVTSDVTAQLVWVGRGSEADLDSSRVAGKIVVTEGNMSTVHASAVRLGAVGIVAYSTSRALIDPIHIPNAGIRETKGAPLTFGFWLSPRAGMQLRDRLLKGEEIIVHAMVESSREEAVIHAPECVIEGTDPNAGEVLLVAHLLEGYVKLGANDNLSGSAVLLETARMLNLLIKQGRIPRPTRSIRFVVGDEFIATIPWAQANRDILNKTLVAINHDMVGIRLKDNNSFYDLHRTPFSYPHYVNDVLENYFRFIGQGNRFFNAHKLSAYMNPVVAPSGSNDPFYYQVEVSSGSSDNLVFQNFGIQVPAAKLITWPDNYYHASTDRPDKLDPTQLKRAVVISAAAAYTIATADTPLAIRILAESYANAVRRLGLRMAEFNQQLTNQVLLPNYDDYKKAYLQMKAIGEVELNTLASVAELAPGDKQLLQRIEGSQRRLKSTIEANLKELNETYAVVASNKGEKMIAKIQMTDQEKKADKLFPRPTPRVKEMGHGVLDTIIKYQPKEKQSLWSENIPNRDEAAQLSITGKNSVLTIKHLMDAQHKKETPLDILIDFFDSLQKEGWISY